MIAISGFRIIPQPACSKGDITGYLRAADALKLYELAYFVQGPILELGTFHGLSASIIAAALKNSASGMPFTSVDLSESCSVLAQQNLEARGLARYATFVASEGSSYLDSAIAQQRAFDFIFVDHSHSYQHVREACTRLGQVSAPGAYILFHDFNDPRNADDARDDYGVFDAVVDEFRSGPLEFCGIYGCAALYHRPAP
jgi:predicted O-methyltransferase YrrM